MDFNLTDLLVSSAVANTDLPKAQTSPLCVGSAYNTPCSENQDFVQGCSDQAPLRLRR